MGALLPRIIFNHQGEENDPLTIIQGTCQLEEQDEWGLYNLIQNTVSYYEVPPDVRLAAARLWLRTHFIEGNLNWWRNQTTTVAQQLVKKHDCLPKVILINGFFMASDNEPWSWIGQTLEGLAAAIFRINPVFTPGGSINITPESHQQALEEWFRRYGIHLPVKIDFFNTWPHGSLYDLVWRRAWQLMNPEQYLLPEIWIDPSDGKARATNNNRIPYEDQNDLGLIAIMAAKEVAVPDQQPILVNHMMRRAATNHWISRYPGLESAEELHYRFNPYITR